jgi:hypothetical protein
MQGSGVRLPQEAGVSSGDKIYTRLFSIFFKFTCTAFIKMEALQKTKLLLVDILTSYMQNCTVSITSRLFFTCMFFFSKVPSKHCSQVPVQKPIEQCQNVPKQQCRQVPIQVCINHGPNNYKDAKPLNVVFTGI